MFKTLIIQQADTSITLLFTNLKSQCKAELTLSPRLHVKPLITAGKSESHNGSPLGDLTEKTGLIFCLPPYSSAKSQMFTDCLLV